jgi:hypothetical protein
MTRDEISTTLGICWKGQGIDYLKSLCLRGLVYDLGPCIRGRGRWKHIYSIPLFGVEPNARAKVK